MINGNISPFRRNLISLVAGGLFTLGLSSCDAVKETPGQINYPAGAEVFKDIDNNRVIITTSKLGAELVDCGRVDKSIAGFRLPVELGGHDVNQSDPVKNKTESPGHVDVTCSDRIITHFKLAPVVGYLKVVTVTKPHEQASDPNAR